MRPNEDGSPQRESFIVNKSELTRFIYVKFKVISPGKQNEDISKIKVNINENLDKLEKLISNTGTLIF